MSSAFFFNERNEFKYKKMFDVLSNELRESRSQNLFRGAVAVVAKHQNANNTFIQ